MEKNTKHGEYTVKILSQLVAMLEDEDCENSIDIDDLAKGDNIKHFFYALTTIAPAIMLKQYAGMDKNALEFNHFANQLCFEFVKIKDNTDAK